MFRVVPDQLRVSEGWVRCGQCHEIFDALAQLQTQPPELELEIMPVTEMAAKSEAEEKSAYWSAPDPNLEQQSQPQPQKNEVLAQPVVVDAPAPEELLQTDPPLQPHELTEKLEPVLTQELSSSPADLREPSFLRESTAPKPRPLNRFLLGLTVLALVLTFLLQFVRHERSRIVAFEPAAKPLLVEVCRLLACNLMPLQQIDAMVLESSSFTKIDNESYRLQFMLKNTALTVLATPSIELTLTDEQDKPLVRRVFTPAESGLASLEIPARSETMGSLNLIVKALETPERISGYRVLAFYP